MDKDIELKNMLVISNEFLKITKISERSVSSIDNIELIPIIVNCTFSVEVALKCLYYANNHEKAKTRHNIKKIYELTKQYGLEEQLLKFFPISQINRILDELENAFDEFRYLYEQKKIIHITPSNLKTFARLINEYCINYMKSNFNIIL